MLSITQKDLAEIAGISLRSLIDVENGKGNPTLQSLAAIGEVLGLELLFRELVNSAASGSMAVVDGSAGTLGSKTVTASTSNNGSITGIGTANK